MCVCVFSFAANDLHTDSLCAVGEWSSSFGLWVFVCVCVSQALAVTE